MTKQQIRKEMLMKRSLLAKEDIRRASDIIGTQILHTDAFRHAQNICLYMPIKNEIDFTYLFDEILEQDKQIWLPKIINNQMDFYMYSGKEQMTEGAFHIQEPVSDVVLDSKSDTFIIMPGAVFSEDGNRIGYGGGYYDRYMTLHPQCTYVAVCYDFQILDTIPNEAHDKKPSFIISEKRMLLFEAGRR